jgi:hypothetical protein
MAKQAKNRARNAARNLGSGMAKKAATKIMSRRDRMDEALKKTRTKYR